MPIRDHPEAFSTIPCETVRYGVLVGVSTGYPPVAGRLHTRYAPVRRSPAVYCYTPLPLDLHVLGLPLAFILSQDQTLHCKNCLLLPLTRLRVSASGLPGCLRHTLSHLSHSFQCSCASSPGPSLAVRFPVESGCKDTTFFQTAKIFFRFFSEFFLTPLSDSRLEPRFFFFFLAAGPKTAPQNPARSPVFPENRPPAARFFFIISATRCISFVSCIQGLDRVFSSRCVSARCGTLPGGAGRSPPAPPAPFLRPLFPSCSSFVPHLFLFHWTNGATTGEGVDGRERTCTLAGGTQKNKRSGPDGPAPRK